MKKEIEESVTGVKVRSPEPKPLWVVDHNEERPAVLLEAGFITNKKDIDALQRVGGAPSSLAKDVAGAIDRVVTPPTPPVQAAQPAVQ